MKTMKLTASPAAKARFERLGPAHKPAAEPLDPAATAAARNAQREQNKRIREILAARYPVFGSAQPLAIGIWDELRAAAGDVITEPSYRTFSDSGRVGWPIGRPWRAKGRGECTSTGPMPARRISPIG